MPEPSTSPAWISWALAGALVGVLALLISLNRRRYRGLAQMFPVPPSLPAFAATDSFRWVDCYLELPSQRMASGGSWHRVAVADEGLRIEGSRLLAGGYGLWIPWDRVERCDAVSDINPEGESNPSGTAITLKGGTGVVRVADPAGDRVLGYWRLFQRRRRVAAG